MFLSLTKEDVLYPTEKKHFLGKWCINYSKELTEIRELEQLVVPYPFDREGALLKAYQYLQQVDRDLFPQITKMLNQFHGVNRSQRYWRMVVGYWWREFIEVLYERYICLKEAADKLPDAKVKVLNERHFVTPYDTKDFEMLFKNDHYNHQLYSQIIHFLKLFDSTLLTDADVKQLCFDQVPPLQEGWRNKIKHVMCFLSRWNKLYIASSYLISQYLWRMGLKLKFFPAMDTPRFLVSDNRVVDHLMRKALANMEGKDEFERLVVSTLSRNFPKIYLEDFSKLCKAVKRNFPKKSVQCILTANAFACNEGFKLFAAHQTEAYKTPFVILQHGGNYGCSAWNSSEDYEKEIADHYLTYGWAEKNNNKVVPFVANRFTSDHDGVLGKPDGDIIWVMASFPRYSYTMYAVPVGPQFIDYLNDQALFLSSLTPVVRSNLKLRSYVHHYGWHDLKYIQQQSYSLQMANLKQSLIKEAASARLIICTYNATAHLETFSLNAPTLLYWNPQHWQLRPEAEAIHQKLHEVGILHYDPIKAAEHATAIYDDVLGWWQQPEVQQARKEFCQLYASTSPHYLETWQQMLKRLLGKKNTNVF